MSSQALGPASVTICFLLTHYTQKTEDEASHALSGRFLLSAEGKPVRRRRTSWSTAKRFEPEYCGPRPCLRGLRSWASFLCLWLIVTRTPSHRFQHITPPPAAWPLSLEPPWLRVSAKDSVSSLISRGCGGVRWLRLFGAMTSVLLQQTQKKKKEQRLRAALLLQNIKLQQNRETYGPSQR